MRAFTVAAALLVAGAQAAPALESRQIIYGCGKSYHIDCGTTSGQIVPNIFAKCTVDGKKPDGITANESDKNAINCPIS
ncbi:hypothetical protein CCUS01_10982 [Colletotrichum cuscutae]|uniref:Uncharacterized protein n=1 Tax=Colletotrichum cuscutae TaxID=1209917 RepID=A0AAI9U6D1_9PEZI|nr:hypothetical protein CCUS01_10982 [Colletotrichum cuscutae]